MPWIESADKTYWLPDVLPEPTNEYNDAQLAKTYLTPDLEIRPHPKWMFDNKSYVSDEYLFVNEKWKLIVDEYPEDVENKLVLKNDPTLWKDLEKENQILVTYKVYEVKDNIDHTDGTIESLELLDQSLWDFDHENLTVTKKYKINYYSEEDLTEKKLRFLREKRNLILTRTDYVVIRAAEQNLKISEKMKNYRQSLRDLTDNINITKYSMQDICNETFFPEPPLDEEIYAS